MSFFSDALGDTMISGGVITATARVVFYDSGFSNVTTCSGNILFKYPTTCDIMPIAKIKMHKNLF